MKKFAMIVIGVFTLLVAQLCDGSVTLTNRTGIALLVYEVQGQGDGETVIMYKIVKDGDVCVLSDLCSEVDIEPQFSTQRRVEWPTRLSITQGFVYDIIREDGQFLLRIR